MTGLPPRTNSHETTRELLRVLARALPRMFRAAPALVVALALTQVVSGLVPAASVLITKWTIDGLTRLVAGESLNVWLLAGAWAGAAFLGQLTGVLVTILQGYVADRYSVETITALMGKMADLPGLDVVEDARFHDDIELLHTGARFRPLNLLATVIGLTREVVAALGLAASLLVVGWWVPLVVLLGMIPLTRAQVRLREAGWSLTIQRTQEARELMYDQRVALRHEYAKEVRLYDLIPWLSGRYRRRAEAYAREMRDMRNKQAYGVLPANALALAVSAGLFAYAVTRASSGAMTVGAVVLLVQALAQVRDHLLGVTEYVGMSTEHARWFSKYFAFLDAQPHVHAPAVPQPVPARPDLVLDGVTFAYAGGAPVLEDVTLTIPYGQTVAVVGENGAGKSTLVKLLLRYYDPTLGHVRLNGTDLREVDPRAWRSRVAAVFQDFARFEYAVRDNILLGAPEDEGRLRAALDGSGFGDNLNRVGGLDVRLGQAFGGADLSGGQWQKLATARALYRDADILVLDEPTAALDPRAEHEVFEQFMQLTRGRTALLITHRLASVLMADRIVVLKAGRVIEDGTHASLLARGGEYATFWRLQAEKYQADPAVRP
ncbi:ABC transporter ATP-binding protein [Deinococcus maricopensis]|uniref:Xenobiotic-transporting ATPase n=1 Tax=Deinococcus maricopensis (strain DSM 21211 / LMG 22137 / NRRL B-23946 / LB-34) TaxID=709986 RepID=E8U5G4_DEIML|nr:ABC transporter ATP-binding protein [Deinococcus maricopensis]ADV66303.1 Xenobiotic-transporting ATPase [Deinococcus maricopensis DSM 21211]